MIMTIVLFGRFLGWDPLVGLSSLEARVREILICSGVGELATG